VAIGAILDCADQRVKLATGISAKRGIGHLGWASVLTPGPALVRT
jgi:hypothetical protein